MLTTPKKAKLLNELKLYKKSSWIEIQKTNNSLTIATAEDVIEEVQIQEVDVGEEPPVLS